eukprot:10665207-Karenia_brevis.AAC.1
MVQSGQYGVAIPGGAEALFHARSTIEELAQTGSCGSICIIDVDLVNCFGRFEWDAIQQAYRESLPQFLAWEQWCAAEAVDVQFPCGDRFITNRGAGQGEPDGPLKASVVISKCVREARQDLERSGSVQWVDSWFLDDGQIVCRPADFSNILKTLDARLHAAGATRGSKTQGDDVKSMVKYFGDKQDVQRL